jgi:predicted DNA-binding protein with PD1-like motif
LEGEAALSCVVLTAVGSLRSLTVRLANASKTNGEAEDDHDHATSCYRSWNECLEVTSLVGTFSVTEDDDNNNSGSGNPDGVEMLKKHLHIAVSDRRGQAFGGHLVSGTVHTTLELVLGTIGSVKFCRELDPRTGYGELVVSSRPSPA